MVTPFAARALPVLPDPLAALPYVINHLLASEPAARAKLAAHAGQSLVLKVAPFEVHLAIRADGTVERAGAESQPAVKIEMPLSALPQLLQGEASPAALAMKIEGDAGLAQTVSELARTLRWDAEEDLSRIVGDMAARRITQAGSALWREARTSQRKFAENVAEYWLEENPELVRVRHVEEHAALLRRMRDDLERLDKRIARLEGR